MFTLIKEVLYPTTWKDLKKSNIFYVPNSDKICLELNATVPSRTLKGVDFGPFFFIVTAHCREWFGNENNWYIE